MFIILLLSIFIIFFAQPVLSEEELFDNPIEYAYKQKCTLSEACSSYIGDIDVEKFIKKELENDFLIVSLDECIDISLKNNFDIQIKYHEYKSSKYAYQNYLTKFLPSLSTNSYINDYRGQFLVGGVLRDSFHETALSANITVQHDLTNGGRQIFEAKAAKYFAKSKNHQLNYTKTQTIYLTVEYYYQMLLNKLDVEILLRNLIERNAQLTLAKSLWEVGYGSKFDVARSESESAQAKIKLLDSLKEFRMSQAKLANLMGIDNNIALMPMEDKITPIKLVNDITVDELILRAMNNREDLKEYKDLITYEKQLKKALYTDFVPKAYIDYQQQFQGTLGHSVKPNYIVSFNIDWMPGYSLSMGTITKIKKQNEQIKVKQLEYDNKLRSIKEAIINAYVASEFNKKALEESKARVDYANKSIQMAMVQFNHGKGTLLDIIQAQTEVTEARVEQVNAIIKYNISQAELLYYSGNLTSKVLIDNYLP